MLRNGVTTALFLALFLISTSAIAETKTADVPFDYNKYTAPPASTTTTTSTTTEKPFDYNAYTNPYPTTTQASTATSTNAATPLSAAAAAGLIAAATCKPEAVWLACIAAAQAAGADSDAFSSTIIACDVPCPTDATARRSDGTFADEVEQAKAEWLAERDKSKAMLSANVGAEGEGLVQAANTLKAKARYEQLANTRADQQNSTNAVAGAEITKFLADQEATQQKEREEFISAISKFQDDNF